MGMGADLHGGDYTKAARRAVSDALRHSSLSFFGPAGKEPGEMFVEVLIGAAKPDLVDTEAVKAEVPYGTVSVTAVAGGLDVPSPRNEEPLALVNAAILVSFEEEDDDE